jgi:hypothetical protein
MPTRQTAGHHEDQDADDTSGRLLDTVTEASAGAVEQLGDAATTAEGAIRRANDSLHRSSDQTLALVGAFSVGTALGLLMGGSSRLLIAFALAPAALVAGVVLERLDHDGRQARTTLH